MYKVKDVLLCLLVGILCSSIIFDFRHNSNTVLTSSSESLENCTVLPVKNPSVELVSAANFNSTAEVSKIYEDSAKSRNKRKYERSGLLQRVDDVYLLKIASCEAGNQGVYGMALVMCVVLNRSHLYDISIRDVIYSPNQFTCIESDLWKNNYITDGAYKALEMVKNGWDESNGAMYFCTHRHNSWHSNNLIYLFTFKDHEFYL